MARIRFSLQTALLTAFLVGGTVVTTFAMRRPSWRQLYQFPIDSFLDVQMAPDGSYFTMTSHAPNKGISIRETATGREINFLSGNIRHLILPDSKRILVWDTGPRLTLLSMPDGAILKDIDTHDQFDPNEIKIADQRDWMAIRNEDKGALLLQTDGNATIRLPAPELYVIAFAPKSNLISVRSPQSDGLHLYRPESGMLVRTIERNGKRFLGGLFSREGDCLTLDGIGLRDTNVTATNPTTGAQHSRKACMSDFNPATPDGRVFLSGYVEITKSYDCDLSLYAADATDYEKAFYNFDVRDDILNESLSFDRDDHGSCVVIGVDVHNRRQKLWARMEQSKSGNSSDDSIQVIPDPPDRIHLFRRTRPEWWYGIFWLWEFWLTAALLPVLLWSILRDRGLRRS